MIDINVNQQCTVILWARGIDIINKHYDRLFIERPKQYYVGDEFSGPLWEIMHIFGDGTYMGPEPPFDPVIKIQEF